MADVIGTHKQHLSPEQRARRRIKNERNNNRAPVELYNGAIKDGKAHHKPCVEYNCSHKKHTTPRGTTKHT